MRTTYKTNSRAPQTYDLRARHLSGEMRRVHGQNARLLFQARKRIMKETIYNRPPLNQPLTKDLYKGERLIMRGRVARFTNTAPYAKYRAVMQGVSKLYGHLLDSFWPMRARQETRAQRTANTKAGLRRVWQKKA